VHKLAEPFALIQRLRGGILADNIGDYEMVQSGVVTSNHFWEKIEGGTLN